MSAGVASFFIMQENLQPKYLKGFNSLALDSIADTTVFMVSKTIINVYAWFMAAYYSSNIKKKVYGTLNFSPKLRIPSHCLPELVDSN